MILTALNEYYARLVAADKAPPYGFTDEGISAELVLAKDGRLVAVNDVQDASGNKPRPTRLRVPQSFKRPGTTPKPFFLWDKTAFVLGVTEGNGKDEIAQTPQQHQAFKAFHQQTLSGSEDEGLRALLSFLGLWKAENVNGDPAFPRGLLGQNVVFRLQGEQRYLHDRPAAQALWSRLISDGEAQPGQCLVTGEREPIARLHGIAIKGVAGAQTAGASIVSFNLDAFESYAKTQGFNAPVSQAAAFAYSTALNHLLRPAARHRQRLQIGDSTVVFWALASDDAHAERAEDLFAALANPPDDEQEAERVRLTLKEMAQGRPLARIDPGLEPDTRFHVLGLAPNAARLSIRLWQAGTLETFAARFTEHYQDLLIEPQPWRTPPAIRWLLREIAPRGDLENVPPQLAGELMRSILSGARYPRSLLANVIMRMRAEPEVNRMQLGIRAALCKAVLTRDARKGFEGAGIEVPTMLNETDTNAGYRLGRAFAVLESAQRAALGAQVNATIRDRFYGSASSTPAIVFPILVRNASHHFSRMRKDGRGGLAFTMERTLANVLSTFGSEFPRSLRLEDQGRFAIGYYHQRFSRTDEATQGLTSGNDPDTNVDFRNGE